MARECPQQLGLAGTAPRVAEGERAAACALAGLSGVGTQSFELLRRVHGALAAAVALGGPALARTEGLRADAAQSLAAAGDLEKRGLWLVEQARRLGAQVLVSGEDGYPTLLSQASSPPPVLYVLGELGSGRHAGVVGARRVDEYGIARTLSVVDHLCAAGVEVVSGGADGVDGVAHRRVLELGGRTVAVLGTGLLNPYPAANRELFERIPAAGALVSEFALDAGGQRTHFPQRNRTLAGLSEAVVLTRGAGGSGALSTCQAAMRLGRPVFAVPGNVGDELAAAPNGLLSQGTARATLDGAEVVAALGMKAAGPAVRPAAAVPENLGAGARRVLEALGPAPMHVDEVAAAAGLSTAQTLAELLGLELAGLCAARPGKYFLRR